MITLYLLSFAVRPVRGVEEQEAVLTVGSINRSALYLHRTAIADDWTIFTNRLAVRAAMNMPRARDGSIGRNSLFSIIREISDESLALHKERRRRGEASDAGRVDNEAAVSERRSGSKALNMFRLRRDMTSGGAEAWEELGASYGAADVDLDVMVEHASALGFDVTSPVPAGYVAHRQWTRKHEDESAQLASAPFAESDEADAEHDDTSVREPVTRGHLRLV